MGLTYVDAIVRGAGKMEQTVRFLVDSGATYSLLPTETWHALKLKPKRKMKFTLADGTQIERNISECHVRLAGEEGHTPVILGEPGDDPLLGAVTLEVLGLLLDPFRRELRPLAMRLG